MGIDTDAIRAALGDDENKYMTSVIRRLCNALDVALVDLEEARAALHLMEATPPPAAKS